MRAGSSRPSFLSRKPPRPSSWLPIPPRTRSKSLLSRASEARLLVRHRALDGVQEIIQAMAEVFGKEAEHEIPALLECGILAAVTPVGLDIGQMLPAVQFDDQVQVLAKQIHFHSALRIEG